jgi:hypothetical protein
VRAGAPEQLIRTHQKYFLPTHFCTAVLSCRRSDYEVGEELLRKYVFIHLSESADKLQLMLAMLHKLYALVSTRAGGRGHASSTPHCGRDVRVGVAVCPGVYLMAAAVTGNGHMYVTVK